MQKANAQTSNIITGYVYSSDDRMPVADANVMFENTDISTTTDSVGFFRLTSAKRHKLRDRKSVV